MRNGPVLYSSALNMQNCLGDREIDRQGDRVHDGRDKGTGHDCGVKTDMLRRQRQHAADDLGYKNNHNEGHADDQGYRDGNPVYDQKLGEIAG